MPRPVIGSRAGAVAYSDNKKRELVVFGFGVYEGEHTPPPDVTFMGMPYDSEFTNHRIKLDSGEHVFGFECWWGSEEAIKKNIEEYQKSGFAIKTITVKEYRAKGD